MSKRAVVVIGASAGGVEALRRVFAGVPETFAGAICVVLHVRAHAPSVLPAILTRAGHLAVRHAQDGDPLEPGAVVVGPPDYHLLVEEGRVRLWKGPHENRQRPAVDALFRSAAAAYGSATVGVVLSGALDDGAAGLGAIKAAGGVAIVQSPGDAAVPDMPRNALEFVAVDYAVPADDIGPLLARLVGEEREEVAALHLRPSPLVSTQSAINPPRHATNGSRELAELTCPDCNGNLWEFTEGEVPRFECRVGHSYSLESLLAAQDESVERALWAGVRSLEENAALSRRLGRDAQRRGHPRSVRHFTERAARTEESVRVLRRLLERDRVTVASPVDDDAAVPMMERES